MNTNKLKSFAQIARRILMEGVSRKITYYGFDAKGKVIEEPIPVAGGVIIREEILDDATIPTKWQALRAAIQRHGVEGVVEEASYTWFNRLMAMQILAKNNYDPTQLEYESAGSVTPVIQARARRGMISYLDRTEQKRVQPLLGDYQNEQKAFAILLTGYCHHHQLLNRIFGRLDDYTELLLPDNILAESGFIHLLNTTDAISDEDYRQVELIGWLYQFYISEKKDQVFASFKKNKKAEAEDIPAATQIFTPNWIVKYMVQNTVGRIWLDHRPTSPLRQKMKYLVEAPNENEVQSPPPFESIEKSLKLLDPACGSGHILVEGFFHLYDIYEEEYYMPAEAVEKILQHNLFGLDIDLRAAQLAQFAVLLAAATKYPDILKKEITPHIYTMPEAAEFSREEMLDFLGSEGIQHEKVLTHALELMQQAKNLGSVMQFNVTDTERKFFIQRLETLQTEARTSLMVQSLVNKILPLLQVFFILTDRFEVVAANPPYMGQKNMNDDLKVYVNKNYPLTKSDLFAVFMEVCLNILNKQGKMSMINQHSWMFLTSYEALRLNLLKGFWFENMLHLGPRTFEELSGEVVQSTAFTLSRSVTNQFDQCKGNYFRLTDQKSIGEKEAAFLNSENRFINISQSNFSKIPGSPIAYWISSRVLEIIETGKSLGEFSTPKSGMSTSDNNRFVRTWYEVGFNDIAFGVKSHEESLEKDSKWHPYCKGGIFKKWYGNVTDIVNWKNNGEEIKKWVVSNPKDPKTTHWSRRIFNTDVFFKNAVVWSDISTGDISARSLPSGCIPDSVSIGLYDLNDQSNFLLGLINSKVTMIFLKFLCPTIHFNSGAVSKLPVLEDLHKIEIINKLVETCIKIATKDWNCRENSWDFQGNPIVLHKKSNLEQNYLIWLQLVSNEFFQLHQCEEDLNRIFIEIYDLKEELTPAISHNDITIIQDELDNKVLEIMQPPFHGQMIPIKKNVVMQQFISYAVGCMMGRYSLDAPGLILANQGETLEDYKDKVKRLKAKAEDFTFLPDDDGIVPMMGSNCGFSDDAVLRLRQFIEAVWGSETLTQNINFLQSCLDMEIEKYMVTQNNFWKDHCSRYKKKPIYWLFSSKKGAFQVLVYMHRMNRFTVQRIRGSYMFKHLQWLVNQKAELERRSATLSRDETRQLDTFRTALTECQEYDLQLKNIADQQIEFDLDDGVSVNYEKFEPLLAGIK